jgi:hypothetical protein
MSMKTLLAIAALLLCGASRALPQSDSIPNPVQQLLDRQAEALKSGDLDALLRDYDEDAVLLWPGQTRRGRQEIRSQLDQFFRRYGLSGPQIRMVHRSVEGDVAFVTWTAKNDLFEISPGTDTYLVRNGKILVHTRTFGVKTLPPTLFAEAPAGWQRGALFSFPIIFAPQIDLTGYEETIFAPGFADPANDNFLTYSFIWWLEGSPTLEEGRLEQEMLRYFQGLSARSVRDVDTTKFAVRLQPDTGPGSWGAHRYSGTITWIEPIGKRLVDTNVKVVTWRCEGPKRTGIMFKISPQPFGSRTWEAVDQLKPVRCE